MLGPSGPQCKSPRSSHWSFFFFIIIMFRKIKRKLMMLAVVAGDLSTVALLFLFWAAAGEDKSEEDASVPLDKVVDCVTSVIHVARPEDTLAKGKDLIHVFHVALSPKLSWPGTFRRPPPPAISSSSFCVALTFACVTCAPCARSEAGHLCFDQGTLLEAPPP